MNAVLIASGLRKHFGRLEAVRDVGFTIASGETYGLLGPNGAGKTTTISMICGLMERDAGEVVVAGQRIDTTTTEARRAIGLVPQDLAIYPDLTPRENLTFFARLQGLDRETVRRRTDEVLEVIGLAERRDDRVEEFSGGMKRRLNIGIGLLHEPQLLVLDEPTVGVDPQSRNAILESVAHLSSAGMGVLYTTHYMEEAERLCDRVGIIDGGVVRAEGTRRELTALVGEHDRVRLRGSGDGAAAAARLRDRSLVHDATAADGMIEASLDDVAAQLPEVLQVVAGEGFHVTGVDVREPDLEAVFLHLTGKQLRD